MPVTTKPPTGYHSVTPSLVVRDARAAMAFYARAFGAVEEARLEGPDGTVVHAEMRIGDSRFMLGEENKDWGALSPLSLGGTGSALHIYVADADAAFRQAVDAGASEKMPMEDAFWGDRYGRVIDPFGHHWSVAHKVRDVPLEEMQKAMNDWMAKASA